MTDGQKLLLALLASVLLNVAFFGIIGLCVTHPAALPNAKPLEDLTLQSVTVSTPTPAPMDIVPLAQPMATPTPIIDSDDLHKVKDAPKKAAYESDENLAAGSKAPASGKELLPSQEGKVRDEVQFSTHRYMLGDGESSAFAPPVMQFAPAPDVPQPHAETRPVPPMRATAPPVPTPEATAAPTPKMEERVAAATLAPTPAPTPVASEEPLYRPTPVPMASVAPTPDLAHPTPVPVTRPAVAAVMNTPRPTPPPVEQTQPQPPQRQGFVPETQQNKIEGSISNRDQPGVDAIATPKGRYEKRISDAIRGRWYYYVDQRRDLITSGSVQIRFYINQQGGVEDLSVLSNDSNAFLAGCSIDAINKARFMPPPQELAPSLENGRFEVIYTFRIYPYQ